MIKGHKKQICFLSSLDEPKPTNSILQILKICSLKTGWSGELETSRLRRYTAQLLKVALRGGNRQKRWWCGIEKFSSPHHLTPRQ